jgi:hypothetical protein
MPLKKYAIVFVLGFWTIGSADTRTFHLYYLEKGQVADRCQALAGRDPAIERLLAGHYIERGEHLVLLIRAFDEGKSLVIDDETYDKLTLEIRHYELGIPLQLNSPEVKLYYSRGTAAFISRADGVFSSRASGTLVIEEKGESHLLIKIDAEIVPQPARQDLPFLRSEKLEPVTINAQFALTKIALEDLTPWLGVRHPSYYKEIHP